MSVLVVTSTASDGSQKDRTNPKSHKVIDARQQFLRKHGFDIDKTVRLRVHFETEDFCRYIEVSQDNAGQGMRNDNVRPADAIITTDRDLALFLPVSDCIGAIIYDTVRRVLALAHLGRHSLEQRGGQRIIQHLQDQYGCSVENLQIWMTPAAGPDVYKIWALDNKGMKEVAHEQLAAAGIKPSQITDNTAETTSNPHYYSYSEFLKGNGEDKSHAIVAKIR